MFVARVVPIGEAKSRPKPISGAGTHIFAGVVDAVEPNHELEGELWYGSSHALGIAHKMERDPHVRRAMDSLIEPILAATWDFQPASEQPIDREVADFCKFVFTECNPWRSALRHALNYVRDGSAVLEVTDDMRPIPAGRFSNHPGDGMGLVFTGFHDIPRRTIAEWTQSVRNPRQIDGIVQRRMGSDVEIGGDFEVSADRLLRFTWAQNGANFDGFAPIRPAYGPWKIKLMLILVSAIHAEREGAGLPFMKLTQDATLEDAQEADRMLSDIRSSHKGRLVAPHWVDAFEYITPKGSPMQLEEAIKRCGMEIMLSLSFQHALLGSKGSGSYALATTLEGQSALLIESHARFIQDVFNFGSDGLFSPIKRLVAKNYGENVELPKMEARNLPTKDFVKAFPVVNSLIQTGAITRDDTLERMMREVLSLPRMDPDTAREVKQVAQFMTGAAPEESEEDTDDAEE